jgi:hypothetical protein
MYDQYEYGNNHPLEEPRSTGECTFELCRESIYFGERNWDMDGEWFCSAICLARYMGAIKRIVEFED